MSHRPRNNRLLKWFDVITVFLLNYLYITSKIKDTHFSTDDVPNNSSIQDPRSKDEHITNEALLLIPPETIGDAETAGNTAVKEQSTPNRKKSC